MSSPRKTLSALIQRLPILLGVPGDQLPGFLFREIVERRAFGNPHQNVAEASRQRLWAQARVLAQERAGARNEQEGRYVN